MFMTALRLLNPLKWKRSFLFLVLGVALIVWFGFLDTYSVLTRYQLDAQRSDLILKTQQMRAEIVGLDQKIDDLESNPELLEKIAREEYGMRREGEVVYRIREKK